MVLGISQKNDIIIKIGVAKKFLNMEIQQKELHRVAVTAIIIKNGRYLIVQRSKNKKTFPGKWTVPGGGVEIDDYINLPKTTEDAWYFAVEKTLQREVKEEVGLEIGNIKYLLNLAFVRQDNIPAIVLSFYCDWQAGEVVLNEENIAYRWVGVEGLKHYEFISGIVEEIEMVDKIIKGENPEKIKFIGLTRLPSF